MKIEKQQLLELLQDIANGGKKSQEILIEKYRHFIWGTGVYLKSKHERSYKIICNLSEEELFDEGVIGLLEAAFDESCWNKFEEVAEGKIARAIEIAVIADIAFRSFVSCLKDEFSLYRNIRARLFRKLKRSPTLKEMEKKLKWSVEKLEQFEKFYQIAMNYEGDF